MQAAVRFKLAHLIGLICLADYAWAIETPVIPGSVFPEQVSRAIKSEQPGQSVSGLPPVLTSPKHVPSALGEQAKKIKFQLNGIILVGNHVYSEEELKKLYVNKLHKVISVAELFEIVQSITNYYRNNGYIISRAILPPQHVKGGVVKIQVIEGYIGKVDVSGTPHNAKDIVLAYGNKIKECPPLNINRMEKHLLIANELPGTEVKAVLAPSKTQVGAADLTLVTQTRLVNGYVSYDDYGTRYIGPQQMTANFGVYSWIASGDFSQVTVTKTPKGGELTYIDVNHFMPITDTGIGWLVGSTRTQTHPLFVLTSSEIDGLNLNYYTTITYPWIRRRADSLTFRTGFNYLDSWVTSLNFPLYTDHIRSLDLGVTYSVTDKYYGANNISVDFRQGLPIMGYTSDYNPQTAMTSRPGGRGDYTKLAGTISRLQAIKGPFSLLAVAQGQWAANPLLASEQFTFGGSQLGRGYDVAELIGDEGMAGSLELRYDLDVEKYYLRDLQIYTFYDAGLIWNFKFIGGVPRKLSGTSTGVGVRFYFMKHLSGNFMWTQTLTKQVAAEELIGDGSRPRVFFSIVGNLD